MAKKRKKSRSAEKATSGSSEDSPGNDDKIKASPKKEAAVRKKSRAEGIIMTVYPAVLGVISGFVSLSLFGSGVVEEGAVGMTYPWYFVMTLVIAVTFYIQRFTFPLLKINVEEFATKDWFYVEFIAIDLWLVTWTLLLN
ncbi:MAG TPA: hypothetical protein PLQ49_08665 [Methanothrix sp.]|nr:hypothetical protein [Methanothrix sp.]HRW83479.1 hypothetical protein [Methanothrix sp.]